ncbi:MAG: zinc ribbon domain-containing protein [Ruminococcaceae bacterium]|nr:zinc ribbon domain-containing protein [Oscillospiraceae bacterium]
MFCQKCGKELVDEAVVCINCGCAVGNTSFKANSDDAPSFGFALLGFFIPLVGLILYILNKDTTPLKARSAGKGALIGVCVEVGISILIAIVYVMLIVGTLMFYY